MGSLETLSRSRDTVSSRDSVWRQHFHSLGLGVLVIVSMVIVSVLVLAMLFGSCCVETKTVQDT